METTSEVMTIAEVAETLRTSVWWVRDAIRSGTWPTPVIHIGGVIRIPRAPVQELVAYGTGRISDGGARAS